MLTTTRASASHASTASLWVLGWLLMTAGFAIASDGIPDELDIGDDDEIFYPPTVSSMSADFTVLPPLDEVAPPATNEIVTSSPKPLRPYVPAQKMTIRRDPRADRLVGNDPENGRSIRSVQLELEQQDNPIPNGIETRALQIGWSDDLPYGKFIYIPHKPLLFEDIPAERYGEVCCPCIEPAVSFAKFFGAIPMAPFKLTANCWAAKHDDAYTAYDHQGNLRPGILEGSYFPDCHVLKDHLCAAVAGTLVEVATFGGIVVFLP